MAGADNLVIEQVLTIAGALVAALVAWFFADYAKDNPLVRRLGRVAAVLVLVALCVFVILRRNDFAGIAGNPAQPPANTTEQLPAQTPSQPPAPKPPAPAPTRHDAGTAAAPRPRPDVPWKVWLPAGASSDQPLIFVVDAAGAYDAEVAAAVARPLGGRAGAFAPAFLSSGAFEQLFSGDSRLFGADEQLDPDSDWLLGKSQTTYSAQDDLAQGMKRVELTLQLRRYQLSKGRQSSVLPLTATGAGFTNASALAVACERISRQIQETLR